MDEKELYGAGIDRYGFLSPAEIPFGTEVRALCQQNVCRLYQTTWACPPAVGTVDECRNICRSYRSAMVFSSTYRLDDSFDFEGMRAAHGAFKKVCDALYFLAKKEYPAFLILSNEGCIRCRRCTYPDSPCRKPEMLFPSMEGFGIRVDKAAEAANLPYSGGKNTVTYFGMLLFRS